MLKPYTLLLLFLCWLCSAQAGVLTLESWRNDDRALWENTLIPAFNRKHPGIEVRYQASIPTEYDAQMNARLANGTAGDLLACRPFQLSQTWYKRGYLERLDGKPGMEYFPASAQQAWQSEDNQHSYCMPVASVLQGFLYNKKIFKQLSLQAPKTEAEFFKLLDQLKAQKAITPIALGTADKWEAAQILLSNVMAQYWRGENGRLAITRAQAKAYDADYLPAFNFLEQLADYLPAQAAQLSYSASQQLFANGQAAIYPMGSWDLSYFNQIPGLEFGVFAMPVKTAQDACYMLDHMDIGIAVNRKSKNKEEAWQFLEWLGSQEFADLYTNKATGFFSLSNHLIAVRDPVARQMMEWRRHCQPTIRINTHFAGTKNETSFWQLSADLLNHKIKAKAAAQQFQSLLKDKTMQ